jgi:hypothetical protein
MLRFEPARLSAGGPREYVEEYGAIWTAATTSVAAQPFGEAGRSAFS